VFQEEARGRIEQPVASWRHAFHRFERPRARGCQLRGMTALLLSPGRLARLRSKWRNLQLRARARLRAALRWRCIVVDADKTLLLVTGLFYVVLVSVGPIFMDEADLDLGGGISMGPNGDIHIKNAPPVSSMRIPDDEEIGTASSAIEH
jgi:hypothetical protein